MAGSYFSWLTAMTNYLANQRDENVGKKKDLKQLKQPAGCLDVGPQKLFNRMI